MNNKDKKISFRQFGLNKDIINAIEKKGFTNPSEVQEKIIPEILKQNNDIIAIAQTGTGKTGAFGLPIIDLVEENNKIPKCIILAPTRELAIQVTKELSSFTMIKDIKTLTVYGGASINNQIRDLRKGVDIVVGTPGRIVDMIKRNVLDLKEIDYFVLDEADEMLNMGFVKDMEFILSKTKKEKRVYLFSATIPKEIRNLSKKYMQNQEIIETKKENNIHTELIDQVFYRVKDSQKAQSLMKIIDNSKYFYAIIFCKMKSDVDKLTRILKNNNFKASAIHGDVPQRKRERILQEFRDQKINILVATDVAARGIDVNNLTHVVNHSLPQSIETYTHRIGRTGRAGNKGVALTLLTDSEMRRLSTLEKITGFKLRKENLPNSKKEYVSISQNRENRINKKFKKRNGNKEFKENKGKRRDHKKYREENNKKPNKKKKNKFSSKNKDRNK